MANKLQCGQTGGHQIGKVEAPQNFLFKYQVILNLSSLIQLKHCTELQVKKEIEKGMVWDLTYELKKMTIATHIGIDDFLQLELCFSNLH